jgi:hypothetical protein
LSRNDSRTGPTSGNRLKPSPVNSPNCYPFRGSRLVSRTSPEEPLLIILDIRALVAGKRRQQPLGQGLEKSSADRSIPPLKRGA